MAGGQQGASVRAPEVAQLGEHDRRRVRVDEQVREHRLADLLDPRLAEPDAEAAADHHGLRVEQVHGGGDAVAERLDGLLEQLLRHLVAALQRSLPDAAGQPVAPALLHDLEQVRLLALLDAAAGARLHRPAPGVGLHAAAAAARAARAVHLDDHVADLRGGPAAEPRLAVEDDPAADAGAPEDAEQGAVGLRGADLELGVDGAADVVAERDGRPQLALEHLAQVERPVPAGQVPRARHGAGFVVDAAGGTDADALQPGRLDARLLGGHTQDLDHLGRDRRRTAVQRRLVALGAEHVVLGVHDRRLDLRAAEIDAAVDRHASF